MDIAVVVPSCREAELLRFVEAWRVEFVRHGASIYVVEDAGEPSFPLPRVRGLPIKHLSWKDAPPGMLECINVRSPCCRQIGFWKAWHDGCDVVVTLDDDVRPAAGTDLLGEFEHIFSEGVPLWIDPLLNYRSRGYPVLNPGRVSIDFHVGCFLGVPDVDAETQLRHEVDFQSVPPRYLDRPTVVPPGFLVPVNGGIAGWRRDLTPYVHFTLWDEQQGYRRFEDIWMGVILKHVFDASGLRMSFGPPFVEHRRASDARKNLKHEKAGKRWNESFWEILRQGLNGLQGPGPASIDESSEQVIRCLLSMDNSWARREGEALQRWRAFF